MDMSQETQQDQMSKKKIVYRLPGTDAVMVQRDLEYRSTDSGALTMDIYYPPDSQGRERIPAVVFVAGYSDVGMQAVFGCKLKEMGSYVSWGEVVAASGLAAITYATKDPITDTYALIQHIRRHAGSLGIDENRIGVWACSGNVPMALSVLMQEAHDYLKCAVLCYGLMLDLEGSTGVAQASKMYGFVNPSAGKSVTDLPRDLPLFIVRAGQDNPQVNAITDRFVAETLNCNLPLTFVNYHAGPHAFDLLHDSDTSREIIRQMLAFTQFHLLK
jgi:hypothetical protein